MTFDAFVDARTFARAWRHVRRNGGGPGPDGQTIEQFARDDERRLARLRADLGAGRYRPGALRPAAFAKKDGGARELRIPNVRDRVVQTALLLVIGPRFEAAFVEDSYGYRPGRSVAHAVGRIVTYRLWGYRWVLEGDIKSCFDTIPHGPVLARLRRAGIAAALVEEVARALRAAAPQGRGLPQGSPLSPLLCNVHLHELDTALGGRRTRIVRYADDFVVMCRDRATAQRAEKRLARVLAALELEANPEKQRITSFADGFEFIGHRFVGARVEPAARAKRAQR